MQRVDVAVVGGGITGLSAAYELHRRGLSFRLFEASGRLGGVILTERVDGFLIDAGPDALLVQKPAAIELCEELGLGPRLQPTLVPRTAYILRRGTLHPLPEASVLGIPTRLAPFARTRLFSTIGKLRFGLDLVLPRRRLGPTDDESIASFFGRRFGQEAVRYLAEPLLATIHAGDVDRLSMRALFPRLLEAEQRSGSLIRALRRLRAQPTPDGMFRSLPGGIGELATSLAAALPSDQLLRGAPVTALDGDGPYVIRGGPTPVSATAVVLAVPAPTVATLLETRDAGLAASCRDIPHASTATVALGYSREHVNHSLRGSGFVVPRVEPDLSIIAASWVSSKWPGRAPHGKVLLRAFIGGARDPDASSVSPTTPPWRPSPIETWQGFSTSTGRRSSPASIVGPTAAHSTRWATCGGSTRSTRSSAGGPGCFSRAAAFAAWVFRIVCRMDARRPAPSPHYSAAPPGQADPAAAALTFLLFVAFAALAFLLFVAFAALAFVVVALAFVVVALAFVVVALAFVVVAVAFVVVAVAFVAVAFVAVAFVAVAFVAVALALAAGAFAVAALTAAGFAVFAFAVFRLRFLAPAGAGAFECSNRARLVRNFLTPCSSKSIRVYASSSAITDPTPYVGSEIRAPTSNRFATLQAPWTNRRARPFKHRSSGVKHTVPYVY